MSVKHWYTDAFSPERPEMLSGDAALLFQPYSGCTGNILSFYPSTSPRSISDPLTINDFFSLPKFASFRCSSSSFPCVGLLISNATIFLFSLHTSPAKFFRFLPIYLNDKDLRGGDFFFVRGCRPGCIHHAVGLSTIVAFHQAAPCQEVSAAAPVRRKRS